MPQHQQPKEHNWQMQCDGCGAILTHDLAITDQKNQTALTEAVEAHRHKPGWIKRHGRHLCRYCQQQET